MGSDPPTAPLVEQAGKATWRGRSIDIGSSSAMAHQVQRRDEAIRRGVIRRRQSKQRKNGRRSPVGMPARVLRVRGVAVPLWPDHSPAGYRRQLAPFPARDAGAGDGGGSIGTRHDFASASRRRYLERARRQFRRSRQPGNTRARSPATRSSIQAQPRRRRRASPSSNSSAMLMGSIGWCQRVARTRARGSCSTHVLICPTGCFPNRCPALFENIFCFSEDPNHLYIHSGPSTLRGAYRDRHGRGAECGGRGGVRHDT